MKKIYVLVLILVISGLPMLAEQVNVTGDWAFTLTTPRGERTSNLKFVQEGDKLTVTMEGMRGEEITGEGTVKGNDLEWSITREGPRGSFTMTYKGKIQDANNITGEVEMGDRGSVSWKATRKTS
ncbi:MAG: hypothetical protein PHQ25_06225 [Acidobacteriota bacterium]|nr:hypothetical protein [Acidobacteriota bacterium]MDW3229837.1 hypothetical protein [Acidobacteriota bacterium]MDY0231536.1 hypothetical protein [Candidatus Saccharicenans sp.]